MINRSSKNKNQRLVTILKWGLGGIVGWNALRPEVRADIRDFVNNETHDAIRQNYATRHRFLS